MGRVFIGSDSAATNMQLLEQLFPAPEVPAGNYDYREYQATVAGEGRPLRIVGADTGRRAIVGGERRAIVGAERRAIVGGERRAIVGAEGSRRAIVGSDVYRRAIVGAGGVASLDTDEEVREELLPITGDTGVSIAAGASQAFDLKPNGLFRPRSLVLITAVAENIVMTALTIGGYNLLRQTGAVPGSLFTSQAFHNMIKSRTARSDSPLQFTLKNIHASVAQVVYGAWTGDASD